MLFLDYQDRRPIYEQIVEKFRMLILSGAVEPSSKMPSVRQLAVELSINPNTIQRAYMELEQQGLICPVKGKGSFVTDSSRIRQIGMETSHSPTVISISILRVKLKRKGTGSRQKRNDLCDLHMLYGGKQ